MSTRNSLLALAALVLVAGCGGGGKGAEQARAKHQVSHFRVVERSVGRGGNQFWLFEPKGAAPKAVVVFIHGLGGPSEDLAANHEPWLRHLASRGDAVIYPRYEKKPGDTQALHHLFQTIPAAVSRLQPRHLPMILIGYSRGGGLAVDYTALLTRIGKPRAVLAVFPVLLKIDPTLDLRSIPHRVRFLFLVGDKDTQVGPNGALDLIRQLQLSGYPNRLIRGEVVYSKGNFKATHLSVLENTPGARKAFWQRADRLIDRVT
jgi:acetyl esterase/lipase